MAVDLNNFIDNLKREINPPGQTLDANAVDDDYAGRLLDAYFDALLDGFDYIRNNYTINEDTFVITPLNPGGPDIPRDLVQLIIFIAGMKIVRTRMLNLKTQYSAKAGVVAIEFQQSAALWGTIYKDLAARKVIVLRRLSDVGILPTIVMDQLVSQDFNIWEHMQFWER